MTVKEARIILLCNNVMEVIYAQSKGALSKDLLSEEDNYDLDELKKQAIEIVLKELEKQDTEINKLNNVIDRMAEELRYEVGMGQDSIFCNDICNHYKENCKEEKCRKCIKEYFMKE